MPDFTQPEQDMYLSLLDTMPGMFYRCRYDEHWTMLDVSKGCEKLTGYTSEELIANKSISYEKIIHEDDRTSVREYFNKNMYEGTLDYEYRIVTKSNKIKWVKENGKLICDDAGQIKYIEGYIQDITESREALNRDETYSRILELLSSGESLTKMLEVIVEAVEEDMEGAVCSILLIDTKGRFQTAAAPGMPDFFNEAVNGTVPDYGTGACGTAAYLKERVITEDTREHPFWKNYRELTEKAGVRSCWSEPIFGTDGQLLGTFGIYHRIPKSPDAEQIEKLKLAVHLVGIAIERKKNSDERAKFFNAVDKQSLNEVYLIDVQSLEVEYTNMGALDNLGYQQEELRKKCFSELIAGYDSTRLYKIIAPLISGKEQNVLFYAEHIRKDGSSYPVETHLQITGNTDESFILANVHDITLRRTAELKLMRSEENLKQAEQIAELGNWSWNPGEGVFTASENMERMLCGSPKKSSPLHFKAFKKLIHDEDLSVFEKNIEKILNSGDRMNFPLRFVIGGEIMYTQSTARAVKNEKGEITGVFGINRNVTQSVLSEREKSRLSAILKNIFEKTTEIITVKDKEGKYLFANDAFNNTFGFSPEGVKGKSDFELFDEKTAAKMHRDDDEIMSGGEVRTCEEDVNAKAGLKQFLTTKGPWVIDGEIKGVFVIARDITEQNNSKKVLEHRNKELKKLNKELDRFVYSTSHDLRSPMTSVMGLVQLSMDLRPDDEELNELLVMMKTSLDRCDDVIKGILDYSRNSRSGQQFKKLDPAKIARDHINAIKHIPEAADIHFEVNANGTGEITGDEMRINAILNNLITNAVKYQRRDEKNKFVKVEFERKNGVFHMLVRDNGEGIPEDKVEGVFRMFSRNSSQSDGTGLGLYIVREMVEALDGKISVRAEKPRGTCMAVEFPEITDP